MPYYRLLLVAFAITEAERKAEQNQSEKSAYSIYKFLVYKRFFLYIMVFALLEFSFRGGFE
jgi:hypothetical protein